MKTRNSQLATRNSRQTALSRFSTMAAGILLSSMSFLQAQNMISAGTADIKIASASDVENTGLFLNYCDPCNNGFAAALCWDGTEPGVAFTDGTITTVYALPQGAHDPDIVLNQETNKARVVYEQGLDIHQIDYDIDPTTLTAITITGPTTLIEDAEHPNIDLNTNQIAAFICKSLIPLGPLGESIPIYIGDISAPVMTHMEEWPSTGNLVYAENFANPNISGACFRPDVAFGAFNSSARFWIYPTFDEEDPSGNYEWWTNSLECRSTSLQSSSQFPTTPNNKTHSFYANPSAGRIATFSTPSFVDTYMATHSANTLANQQVDAYFGQSALFTKVDWFNPDPYSAINPAIDWIADPYVNIAWTADDKIFTDVQDIIVAQYNHNGVPYFPGDWSRANMITPKQQHIVSISGLEVGRENPNDLFGYCWVDDNRFIRYKYNAATIQALKRGNNENIAFISPNPAYHTLLIQSAHDEALQRVVVYDLFGKKLTEKQSIESSFELNISHWPAGVYLVVVNDGQPQRLIKL